MGRTPASGAQHTLRAGPYRAVVASVGASLRALSHDDRDLVVPFDADEVRPHYRGATLAPWPNRVVDGTYRFEGVEHRLALTEPDRGHALHGLLVWTDYEVVDKGSAHVTLAATIEPQTGYPWRVRVQTTYSLTHDGLRQTVAATNESPTPAPWGTGPHPYLLPGSGSIDDATLHLPADRVLAVTPDRLIPTREEPVTVDAARFDFRSARPIGAVEIDHAFTGLHRSADGAATVRLTDAAGSGVAMTFDQRCPWVQIHTADRPDGIRDPAHRAGLAVEPMTCPPDAFTSGVDLVSIATDETVTASWSLTALPPGSDV